MSSLRIAVLATLLATACADEPDPDLCATSRPFVGETTVGWTFATEAVSGTPTDQLDVLVSVYGTLLARVDEFHERSQSGCDQQIEAFTGTATATPAGGTPISLPEAEGGYNRRTVTGLAAQYSLSFTEPAGELHSLEWTAPPAFTLELQDIGDGGTRIVTSAQPSGAYRERVRVTQCDGINDLSVVPVVADDQTVSAFYPAGTQSLASIKVTLAREQLVLWCEEGHDQPTPDCQEVMPGVFNCSHSSNLTPHVWGCQSVHTRFEFSTTRGC